MDEDIVWTHLCSKTKVLESNANNSTIFEQREIFGVDLYSVITQFTKVVLISENCAKYKFNEHWNAKQKKYSENVVRLKNWLNYNSSLCGNVLASLTTNFYW